MRRVTNCEAVWRSWRGDATHTAPQPFPPSSNTVEAICCQVANAEARGQELDEQAEEVQAARAAEREAAAQVVAHQEQV